MILCVLVSSCRCLEPSAKSVQCDVQNDDNKFTITCSHRNIESITSWPEEINDLDKGKLYEIRIANDPKEIHNSLFVG